MTLQHYAIILFKTRKIYRVVDTTKTDFLKNNSIFHAGLQTQNEGSLLKKSLDLQILLHPFEKELNLPPFPVDFGDSLGGKMKDVSKEEILVACLNVQVTDEPQYLSNLSKDGKMNSTSNR